MKLILYILYLIFITIIGNLLYYKINNKKSKKYFTYSLKLLLIYVWFGWLLLG